MVLSDLFDTLNTSKPPPRGKHAEQTDDDDDDEVGKEYSDDDFGYDDHDNDDDEDEDDYEEDEERGLGCPFCSEDFDVLGFCCHIDLAHHKEVKAAICPVCVTRVEDGMTVHLITKHESILKILSKKKRRNGGCQSAISFFKKELQDECLQTSSKGSSPVNSSAVVETDSLFLPFCYRSPSYAKPETAHPSSEASLTRSRSLESDSESREMEGPLIPDKNEDKAQKCDFVKEILFSIILEDDNL